MSGAKVRLHTEIEPMQQVLKIKTKTTMMMNARKLMLLTTDSRDVQLCWGSKGSGQPTRRRYNDWVQSLFHDMCLPPATFPVAGIPKHTFVFELKCVCWTDE